MEPQTRMDPSWRKLRSYSGMANTWRKHTLQLPTSDGRPSSSDICGLPITTQKLTGLARLSPCLDALLSVEDGQTEAWQRTTDQNPEMRFMPCSSPLSGRNTTLGLQVPHRSGWPRKRRRLRLASLSRTWCQCKQANWKLGLRNALHFSVSRGVIQRKERGPAKWQLAAYNRVHNKRMADGDRPTSTVNPQQYLQTRPSGTGSLEQYKIRPTC